MPSAKQEAIKKAAAKLKAASATFKQLAQDANKADASVDTVEKENK